MQTIKITRAAAIQSLANLGAHVSPAVLTYTLAEALARRISKLSGVRYEVEIVSASAA